MLKGRHYDIPPFCKAEFEHHVALIGQSLQEPKRIPSNRSYRALSRLKENDWIEQYYFSLYDKPGAIIISKGWSFNEDSAYAVNELMKEGWFCIAALQAVDACNKYGVKPHAYCIMDPQDILVQYWKRTHEDAIIFMDMMVDPVFYDIPRRKVLFASFSAHIHDFVLKQSGMFVIDLPNHTVSEIMQAIVQHMGAQRVFFVGVDYCTKDLPEVDSCQKCHADVPKPEPKDGMYRYVCPGCGAVGYESFEIFINKKLHYSNSHYCLGLQAFLRHMFVDHYSVEVFADQYYDIMDKVEKCDKTPWTPSPIPYKWKNFDFFNRIAHKKRKKWHFMHTGLSPDRFGEDLIRDFNP